MGVGLSWRCISGARTGQGVGNWAELIKVRWQQLCLEGAQLSVAWHWLGAASLGVASEGLSQALPLGGVGAPAYLMGILNSCCADTKKRLRASWGW